MECYHRQASRQTGFDPANFRRNDQAKRPQSHSKIKRPLQKQGTLAGQRGPKLYQDETLEPYFPADEPIWERTCLSDVRR